MQLSTQWADLLGREPNCGHEVQIWWPLVMSYSSKQMAPAYTKYMSNKHWVQTATFKAQQGLMLNTEAHSA